MGADGEPVAGVDVKHLVELQKELRELYTLLLASRRGQACRAEHPPAKPLPVPKPRVAPTPFPKSALQLERDATRERESGLFDHLDGGDYLAD